MEMLLYARTDTRYLIPLCALLLHTLCDCVEHDEALHVSVQRELIVKDTLNVKAEPEFPMDSTVEIDKTMVSEDRYMEMWHDVPSPPPPRRKTTFTAGQKETDSVTTQSEESMGSNDGSQSSSLIQLRPSMPKLSRHIQLAYVETLRCEVLPIVTNSQKHASVLWSPGAPPTPLSKLLNNRQTSQPRPHCSQYKKIDSFRKMKKSNRWTALHTHLLMR